MKENQSKLIMILFILNFLYQSSLHFHYTHAHINQVNIITIVLTGIHLVFKTESVFVS